MFVDACLQHNKWLCSAAEERTQAVLSQRSVTAAQNTDTKLVSCTGLYLYCNAFILVLGLFLQSVVTVVYFK